ncbi:MAG: rhomboid family intramembrane serine protease [Gammaproteobacteria bacterium]|nr:rhomboid family intramembrane serine protease [Gammaproteobacteria bacterium]
MGVQHAGFALLCVLFLWLVHIVNFFLKYRLNYLGIYPRHIFGLPGILFSPFLHGNFEHLLLNSIPAFFLIDLVSIYGMFILITLTIYIILASGLLIWLFGRPAIHVGASGVMLGYWGFLLLSSYHNGSAMAIILALICLYYLGSMALSLLPLEKGASWEAHVFGFASGVSYVYLLPYLPVDRINAFFPADWTMS